jgi:hypothetical protein
MIPDKLLINLKILGKIQKNGRISRSCDGLISLESDTIYQPLKRLFYNDSRKQAIFEINSIVTECIDTLAHIVNSKYLSRQKSPQLLHGVPSKKEDTLEFNKHCEEIYLVMQEMEKARVGIENLKFTYQNDPNISSQIDIIILKIDTTLRDISNKLAYLGVHINNTNEQNEVDNNDDNHIIYMNSLPV